MTKCKLWTLLFAASAVAALPMSGCDTQTPGAESVLLGTWQVDIDGDFDLTQTFITFDAFGNIEEIRNIIGSISVANEDVSGTTSVSGNTLVIETNTNLRFQGTFNDNFTVATGDISTEYSIGGTTVTIDQGTATMTKL